MHRRERGLGDDDLGAVLLDALLVVGDLVEVDLGAPCRPCSPVTHVPAAVLTDVLLADLVGIRSGGGDDVARRDHRRRRTLICSALSMLIELEDVDGLR